MDRDLPPRRCGSYRPGHEPHYIQALRGLADKEHPPVAGRLLEVDPEGMLTVEAGDVIHRLWNHEAERLGALAGRNGNRVSLQSRWSALRTRSPDGSFVFSVCPAESPGRTPCPDGPPPDDLVELVLERGGFILSAAEIERRLVEYPPLRRAAPSTSGRPEVMTEENGMTRSWESSSAPPSTSRRG